MFRCRQTKVLTLTGTALCALYSGHVDAGDNIEVPTAGNTVISHELWHNVAFPLNWLLHEDGVVNNNAVSSGTPALTNAETQAEISAAFQVWEDVSISGITVTYGGETAVSDSGCDLNNIVTWSDSGIAWPAETIARGIATSYVGPALTLDATNRTTIPCGDGGGTVSLPVTTYPNGTVLQPGTILDMDMTWNPNNFDYVNTPNSTANVFDIRGVAAHEFGHMFGFSHTSMAYDGTDAATMYPAAVDTSIAFQNNIRALNADDIASSGAGYPGSGFFPTGSTPYATGIISGSVLLPAGPAAEGVRVWAYDVADTSQPVYETFTLTQFDWDTSKSAGDYVLSGLDPGDYYVCILPWANDYPTAFAADKDRYNLTTINGSGHTGFATECYDDVQYTGAAPDLSSGVDLLRKVTVTAGQATPNINFVTGAQKSDFVLVMDRSGSMGLPSGTPSKNKLQALQDAANALVDFLELSGGHRLGLVQFEEVLVPLSPVVDLQPLSASVATDAHTAINAMASGGWTNIIGGVEEAIDQLTTVSTPNGRQVMLVFSDGKHNRPIGSDLNDVGDDIVDNDIRLYSVGFGTDVDDAILSDIARSSGGVHVNEQDLDPLALDKHFLSIAASAADASTLVDPRFTLRSGRTVSVDVEVTPDERDLTFAVLWETRNADRVQVWVQSPDGCKINAATRSAGAEVRSGKTYRLVHVPLPWTCNGQESAAGTWQILAQGELPNNATETVEIVVYGSSRTQLYAQTFDTRRGPVITARVLREARVVRGGSIVADVLAPLRQTGDSEKLDGWQREERRPFRGDPPREKRLTQVVLHDDGKHHDGEAGDGLFGSSFPVNEPGLYQLHLKAKYPAGARTAAREATTSYHFKGQGRAGIPHVPPRRVLHGR